MRDAIREKLARAFAGAADSEMEVVYVLVEIRKYLEQNRALRKKHRRFISTAAGPFTRKPRATERNRVLERFDRLYPLMKSGLTVQQSEETFRTFTLRKFKEELVDFLDTIGVASPIKSSRESEHMFPIGP